ncbi:MAG TPA: hypothetical protein VGB16_01545 [candidate division Zixibacteria bacterium]
MLKTPKGLELPEIPLDKKYRTSTKALLSRINTIYKGLYKKFGEAGLDLIQEVSHTYGKQVAEFAKKKMGNPTPQEVGLYLLRIFSMIDCEGEVSEFSDDKVVIKLYQCPYPFDDPKICQAHTTMERTLVEELNKDLEYVISESIPSGGKYCVHVVKWKEKNR